MTKKFPPIGPKNLIKVLLKLGYKMQRQKGNHQIYKHPKTKNRVVIPVHNADLKKGLVQGIIKTLKLSKEAFLELL